MGLLHLNDAIASERGSSFWRTYGGIPGRAMLLVLGLHNDRG